ncbi:MAG: VWA domain-containing protein [Pseudomonadota bacterium]
MIRHSRWLALAASAVLVAACGGNDPEASAAAPPGETNEASVSLAEETVEGTETTPVSSDASDDLDVELDQGTEPAAEEAPENTSNEDTPEAPPQAEVQEPDEDPSEEPTEAASTDGAESIMVVFDGSGSMWGQIDGRAKIEIAREALGDLLTGLPEASPTGLMAYGHRREGDCEDIEVLQTPQMSGAEAILTAAGNIVPRGKTPLSAAVEEAAELLSFQDTPATVVLITDGIETCNVDPCALGESLESRGVNFTAHIIGFGLSEQEGRQVACLAQETGGQYIQASDAGELSDAMEQVAEAVEEPVAEEVELQTAEISAPDTVEIGHAFDVDWVGPETPVRYDYVDLVEADYDRTSRSLSSSYASNGPPVTLRAPAEPGVYKVRYVWLGTGNRTVIAEQTIDVTDAEAAIFAPERVGIGKRFEMTWRGPNNRNDYIDLVPPDQTATNTQVTYAYTKNGEVLEMTAPGTPGDYQLRYVTVGSGGERVLTSVPITVEDIRAEVAFNPNVEIGSTLDVNWTGPDTRNDYIDIVERGFERTNTQLSYRYTRDGNPAELSLPTEAGEYDVRYILASTSDGERILATAPLTLTETAASLDFPAEVQVGDAFEVEWTGPAARNDYIDIVERGFEPTNTQIAYAYTRNGSPAELRLPGQPGEYDVRYILRGSDGERVLLTKPLTLVDREVTLDFAESIPLGRILEVQWTGPEGRNDYVDIVEVGQRKTNSQLSYTYTRTGDILELKLPVNPGDYEVRLVHNAADGKRVMMRAPLTVTDVDASITGPDTAETDAVLEINWEGPAAQGDFIDVVPRGKQLPKDSITYAYTRTSNPVELRMPDEPGEYDMRYIHVGADGRAVKARQEITVE